MIFFIFSQALKRCSMTVLLRKDWCERNRKIFASKIVVPNQTLHFGMSLNAFTNNSHHKTGYMQLVSSLNARSWLKFLDSIRLSTFLCHQYHYHHSPTSLSSFDQSPNDASGVINQSINRRRNIFEKKSIHYIYQHNSQRNKIIISWCCRLFAVFIYSNYRPVLQIPEFTGIL